MEVIVKEVTNNEIVMNSARLTIWKEPLDKEPSYQFMDNMYMAEHSPIRCKEFWIEIHDVKSWVITHLLRHHVGSTPFISTQRDDRIQYEGSRDDRPQGSLVNAGFYINSQALINMAKKRLCFQAHEETRQLMLEIKRKVEEVDPALSYKMVPECVYRGFCPELSCCGFCRTNGAKEMRIQYIGNRQRIKY